jgi:hypothetical protein
MMLDPTVVDEMLAHLERLAQGRLASHIAEFRAVALRYATDPRLVIIRWSAAGLPEIITRPTDEERQELIREYLRHHQRSTLRDLPRESVYREYAIGVALVKWHLDGCRRTQPDYPAAAERALRHLWSSLGVFPALRTTHPFPPAIVQIVVNSRGKHMPAARFVMELAGLNKKGKKGKDHKVEEDDFVRQVRRDWKKSSSLVIAGYPAEYPHPWLGPARAVGALKILEPGHQST